MFHSNQATHRVACNCLVNQFRHCLSLQRYVFLVHFYNPDHTGFSPRVVVDGGVTSTGTANVTYCPFAEGCRAVVTTDDGRTVIDITVPTTTFTITVPEGNRLVLSQQT